MGVVAYLGLARSDQPAPSNFAVLRSSTRQRLETVRKQSTSSDLDTLSTEQQQTPVLQYHRHLAPLGSLPLPLHPTSPPPHRSSSRARVCFASHRIASPSASWSRIAARTHHPAPLVSPSTGAATRRLCDVSVCCPKPRPPPRHSSPATLDIPPIPHPRGGN